MITKDQLQQAITECLETPNPNANTCIKLAAFYVIADHMVSDAVSGNMPPALNGKSEFMQIAERKPPETVLHIMDRMMDVLQAVNPMLYDNTIRDIKNAV